MADKTSILSNQKFGIAGPIYGKMLVPYMAMLVLYIALLVPYMAILVLEMAMQFPIYGKAGPIYGNAGPIIGNAGPIYGNAGHLYCNVYPIMGILPFVGSSFVKLGLATMLDLYMENYWMVVTL